jgi:hypothetical protein
MKCVIEGALALSKGLPASWDFDSPVPGSRATRVGAGVG